MPRRYVLPLALLAPAPIAAAAAVLAGAQPQIIGFMLLVYLGTMALIGGFVAVVLSVQLRGPLRALRAVAAERGGAVVGAWLGDPSLTLPEGSIVDLCTTADSLGAARAGRYGRWTRLTLPGRGPLAPRTVALSSEETDELGPLEVRLDRDRAAIWLPGYLADADLLRRLLDHGPAIVERARER